MYCQLCGVSSEVIKITIDASLIIFMKYSTVVVSQSINQNRLRNIYSFTGLIKTVKNVNGSSNQS